MTSASTLPTDAASTDTKRSRGRFLAGILVGLVTGALLALDTSWFLQGAVILHDDTTRGERYAELIGGTDGFFNQKQLGIYCELAAEGFYGHPMFDAKPGWAPRSEKAFYKGCSGNAVGGLGY